MKASKDHGTKDEKKQAYISNSKPSPRNVWHSLRRAQNLLWGSLFIAQRELKTLPRKLLAFFEKSFEPSLWKVELHGIWIFFFTYS
jgi:hypothetical protein